MSRSRCKGSSACNAFRDPIYSKDISRKYETSTLRFSDAGGRKPRLSNTPISGFGRYSDCGRLPRLRISAFGIRICEILGRLSGMHFTRVESLAVGRGEGPAARQDGKRCATIEMLPLTKSQLEFGEFDLILCVPAPGQGLERYGMESRIKKTLVEICKRTAAHGSLLTKCARPPRRRIQPRNVTWRFVIKPARGSSRIIRKQSSGSDVRPSKTMLRRNVTWAFATRMDWECRSNLGRRPNG